MRIKFSHFVFLAATTLLAVGCAGPERKFGRGLNNLTEFPRGGEMRRSFEQATLFGNSDAAYTSGMMHGFNRSMKRTFVGVYEVLTFPIPDHKHNDFGPIMRPEHPVYPDAYKPNWIADQIIATDTALGFSGGDVAPFLPGSRFRIFDN